MRMWAPIWNGIVDSSLWDEPDYVVKVFLTMLAVKDMDHIVRLNAYQIKIKSRKTEDEVLNALKILSSPDTKRKERQEFDGRRIEAVEEGWLILNGQKYRDMVQIEMRRARNRKAQLVWRAKQAAKAVKNGVPLSGEASHERAAAAGASQEQLNRIASLDGRIDSLTGRREEVESSPET